MEEVYRHCDHSESVTYRTDAKGGQRSVIIQTL